MSEIVKSKEELLLELNGLKKENELLRALHKNPPIVSDHILLAGEVYRDVIENMGKGSAYCKMLYADNQPNDFIYIEVNTAFETLTGMKNIKGKKNSEAIPGVHGSDSEILEVYSRVALTGKPENFETHFKALNIWFSISVTSPQKDYFVAIFDNITQNKQAEKSLVETNNLLSSVIEGTNIGTWVWNVQTGESSFNERWAEIIGYTLEELAPVSIDTWTKLVHPDDAIKSAELLNKHFNGTLNYYDFDCRMKHKNGHWVWVRDRGKVKEWTNDGKPFIMTGTHSDITERKNAELIIRNNEQKFRELINNLQVGVLLHDHQTKILVNNPKALELLGLTEDQFLGKTSFDTEWNVIHEDGSPFPEETHPVSVAVSSKISVKGVVMGVYRPLRADRVWLLVDAFPELNINGTVRQVVVTFVDITDLKNAEKEILLKNEQLTILNSEKDKYFSIIAHDLRSPFNGFLGVTELLAQDINNFTLAEISNFMSMLNKSGTNLYNLLNNLLNWAKMQRGEVEIKIDALCINDILRENVDLISLTATQKEISITVLCESSTEVLADKFILNTILRNLLSNAVKFSYRGSKINVSVSAVNDSFIEVAISDSGVGMSKKEIDKLFKLNEKVSSKGTEDEASTGLGLILCKEFVEKLGGEIWVESEEGKGSSFKFTLKKALQH